MFTLCMSRGANKQILDNAPTSNHCCKQIKGGYLLRYKRGLFCRTWCEEWVVLYEDSTIAWFKDKGTPYPRGRIRLSDSPELLAVGEWTQQVPQRPRLPNNCHLGQMMAFGCRKQIKVHWLIAQSAEEVSDWMTAISNTLPPPPRLMIDRDKRCSITLVRDHRRFSNGFSNLNYLRTLRNGISGTTVEQASNQSYENEHTVPAGVVIDWGHGWGWGESAWFTQLAYGHEAVATSALYCSTLEDYNIGGYDDVGDYSACGDFSF